MRIVRKIPTAIIFVSTVAIAVLTVTTLWKEKFSYELDEMLSDAARNNQVNEGNNQN